MSELLMAESAWELIAKQKIMPNDVILLRQNAFPNGVQTPDDVATLLAIETACDEKCPQWNHFFITTISHYMVHDAGTDGTIDADQCDWLRRSVTRNGLIDTQNEFELLLDILEEAQSGPASLCSLVLDHLCRQVYQCRSETGLSKNLNARNIVNVWLKRVIAVAHKFSVHEELRAKALLETVNEQYEMSATSDYVESAQRLFKAA